MRRAVLALAGLLLASTAPAAPAPWYLWRSRLNGETVCAKVLAGAWDKVAGPFTDSRCEQLVRGQAVPAGSTLKFQRR